MVEMEVGQRRMVGVASCYRYYLDKVSIDELESGLDLISTIVVFRRKLD